MLRVAATARVVESNGSAPMLALNPPGYVGHTHFWERALSRRHFVRASALGVGASLVWPAVAALADSDKNADPNPIPGGTAFLAPSNPTIFHANFPVFGQEV